MYHSPLFVENIFCKCFIRWGGQSKKYWNFKVLQSIPCWYSQLVSRDAWFNEKGLSSIGSSWAEKTSKMCQNIGSFLKPVKRSKFQSFLGFFSDHIDPIELKPFSLNQASRDTSIEYQQGILWSTLKFQYFWHTSCFEFSLKWFKSECWSTQWVE